jgi:hypothetical protein
MNQLVLRRIAAPSVLLLSCCQVAAATTVAPPSFNHLVDSAARVVVAEVVRVEPRAMASDGGRSLIVSAVTFRTLRAVKGETAATFTLEFLGGTLGDQTLEVVGAPRWVVGDRDVLFVAPGRSRLSPLVRMMHGRVRVMVDAAGVETVAFHNGDPIPDPGAFGAARPQRRSRAGRPMSLAVFLAAVEARLRARGGA